MSSASSAVTYTSVYTDSEPGRVFWGADEEIPDGGKGKAGFSLGKRKLRKFSLSEETEDALSDGVVTPDYFLLVKDFTVNFPPHYVEEWVIQESSSQDHRVCHRIDTLLLRPLIVASRSLTNNYYARVNSTGIYEGCALVGDVGVGGCG
ncbi:hypothetical protein Tco_0779261, partial [Tanacetum coccineum]